MEVLIPSPSPEFDFGSGRSSPLVLSAPSTPKRFGEYYFSAPNSPSRMADFYRDFDEFSSLTGKCGGSASLSIPFGWEEKPRTPKSPKAEEEDFAFDFCKDLESASLPADELFDGGQIRSLKPSPRLQLPDEYKSSSGAGGQQRSVWPGKRISKGKESDPFKAEARKNKPERERGRDREPGSGRAARSLSPYRVSSYLLGEEEEEKEKQQFLKLNNNNQNHLLSSPFNSSASSSSKSSGSASKKWRLKDFFLFRSASEGRATDKDPFRKYAAVFRRQEEIRNSSFRSAAAESGSSGSISRRRSGQISAHELHYTVNKAVSEDLKKRTFLPYKQGILGRLSFNPAVHALANGFGSLYR